MEDRVLHCGRRVRVLCDVLQHLRLWRATAVGQSVAGRPGPDDNDANSRQRSFDDREQRQQWAGARQRDTNVERWAATTAAPTPRVQTHIKPDNTEPPPSKRLTHPQTTHTHTRDALSTANARCKVWCVCAPTRCTYTPYLNVMFREAKSESYCENQRRDFYIQHENTTQKRGYKHGENENNAVLVLTKMLRAPKKPNNMRETYNQKTTSASTKLTHIQFKLYTILYTIKNTQFFFK